MATGDDPRFATVTFCGTPTNVKSSDDGESVIGPPDPTNPTPDKGTIRGEFAALLGIARAAFRTPVAEGTKLICTVQLAVRAKLVEQLLVIEKSLALTPMIERVRPSETSILKANGLVPLFEIVTVCGVSVKETYVAGNRIAPGDADNPDIARLTVKSAGASVSVG
jgi:hypothetical protein